MTFTDTGRLRCPTCRGTLTARGDTLACTRVEACGPWPVVDGIPRLLRDTWVRGPDRLMRHFYDGLPSLHDPAVRWLLPFMEGEGSEDALRNGYVRRMELEALPQRPVRILEVSVGTGANLGRVLGRVSSEVEYWGLDLSAGMLNRCAKRLRHMERTNVHLVQGDAHALPFDDAQFDRVFHVGGIGGFRDPGKALAEMARVARPGTPIVVCDERLDPARTHGLVRRGFFKALTFYDTNPHCPSEALPSNAFDVLEEQVSRFYYCLRFRVASA